MEWQGRRNPNTPALRHSSTPILAYVHSSGSDEFRAEFVNVASGVLTLIVQQDVFRHAVDAVIMAIEMRTLIGPVRVVEHESIHRNHDAVLGTATRCVWVARVIKKIDRVVVEVRSACA